MVSILGIASGLRRSSHNRAALVAARETAQPDATLEKFDLRGIPSLNRDREGTPAELVKELKKAIRNSDTVLV